jgi:ABC-type Na+ efflux pump permease subunit
LGTARLLIPIFSPGLLPVATGAVPAAEAAMALALMALTVVAAAWLAARIYSAGVLLYGQPSWRAVLRAARVPR